MKTTARTKTAATLTAWLFATAGLAGPGFAQGQDVKPIRGSQDLYPLAAGMTHVYKVEPRGEPPITLTLKVLGKTTVRLDSGESEAFEIDVRQAYADGTQESVGHQFAVKGQDDVTIYNFAEGRYSVYMRLPARLPAGDRFDVWPAEKDDKARSWEVVPRWPVELPGGAVDGLKLRRGRQEDFDYDEVVIVPGLGIASRMHSMQAMHQDRFVEWRMTLVQFVPGQ